MCASPAESPRDLAVHLTGEGGWPAEQGGHPGRLRTRTTPFMLLMSFMFHLLPSSHYAPNGLERLEPGLTPSVGHQLALDSSTRHRER